MRLMREKEWGRESERIEDKKREKYLDMCARNCEKQSLREVKEKQKKDMKPCGRE